MIYKKNEAVSKQIETVFLFLRFEGDVFGIVFVETVVNG